MGHPPSQRPAAARGLVVGMSALLAVLLVVLGVLVVLLVRDRSAEPGTSALTAPGAEPAASVPDADPTSGQGTQNFANSRSFAEAFVQRLVDRDAEAAYDVLCEASRGGRYPDADALQEFFDALVRGTVVEFRAGNVVGTAGTDYVSIHADIGEAFESSLTVVIEDEDGRLAVCAIDDASAAPTY